MLRLFAVLNTGLVQIVADGLGLFRAAGVCRRKLATLDFVVALDLLWNLPLFVLSDFADDRVRADKGHLADLAVPQELLEIAELNLSGRAGREEQDRADDRRQEGQPDPTAGHDRGRPAPGRTTGRRRRTWRHETSSSAPENHPAPTESRAHEH